MINLNRIEVIGNLTRDPELRFTPNGQAVASFAVATNRRYRDQAGNWVDSPPEYHEIVVWGQLAENCQKYLHKGERVFVSGRQQTRSWEAQDGSKRYKTELIVDAIIGPDQVNKSTGNADGIYGNSAPETHEEQAEADSAAAPASKSKAPAKKASTAEEEINIDDIPF